MKKKKKTTNFCFNKLFLREKKQNYSQNLLRSFSKLHFWIAFFIFTNVFLAATIMEQNSLHKNPANFQELSIAHATGVQVCCLPEAKLNRTETMWKNFPALNQNTKRQLQKVINLQTGTNTFLVQIRATKQISTRNSFITLPCTDTVGL